MNKSSLLLSIMCFCAPLLSCNKSNITSYNDITYSETANMCAELDKYEIDELNLKMNNSKNYYTKQNLYDLIQNEFSLFRFEYTESDIQFFIGKNERLDNGMYFYDWEIIENYSINQTNYSVDDNVAAIINGRLTYNYTTGKMVNYKVKKFYTLKNIANPYEYIKSQLFENTLIFEYTHPYEYIYLRDWYKLMNNLETVFFELVETESKEYIKFEIGRYNNFTNQYVNTIKNKDDYLTSTPILYSKFVEALIEDENNFNEVVLEDGVKKIHYAMIGITDFVYLNYCHINSLFENVSSN